MRAAIDTCLGLLALLKLLAITRFRTNCPYWAWRHQTAFGRGRPTGLAANLVAILHYARWIHTMNRLSKASPDKLPLGY